MQVTLSIDLDNEEQRNAMKVFMDTIGTGEAPKLRKVSAKDPDEDDEDDEEETPEERKKRLARERAAKSRERKKKEEAKQQKAAEEDEDEEDDLLGDEEEEIDLALLREITAKKVKESTDNRDAIKEQLAKMKVKKVSDLPEAKFESYYNLIKGL